MRLQPFLLDQWLDEHKTPANRIEYDLASSTGPEWPLRELLEAFGPEVNRQLLDSPLVYSDSAGSTGLRSAIADMLGVSPGDVQIVTGASEALLILFFLTARGDANVILPFPCFPTISALPDAFGLEVRHYRLLFENDYRVAVDEILALADANTAMILVNSPHNPTGATLDDLELRSLHDFAVEKGIQFVVDEVYHPIYHGGHTRSAAALEKATVLGDFSKALSLSGLRVGWIIERDQDRMNAYRNARQYFTISNSSICETIAKAAAEHSEMIYDRVRRVTSANLRLLDQFFAQCADVLSWVRPNGGMTAFPRLVDGSDARRLCAAMAERGVLLAPGDCFGMPSHFRLGFGARGEAFKEGLDRLTEFARQILK